MCSLLLSKNTFLYHSNTHNVKSLVCSAIFSIREFLSKCKPMPDSGTYSMEKISSKFCCILVHAALPLRRQLNFQRINSPVSDVFPRRRNFYWNVRHFQVSYSDLSQFILTITKTLNWNFKWKTYNSWHQQNFGDAVFSLKKLTNIQNNVSEFCANVLFHVEEIVYLFLVDK